MSDHSDRIVALEDVCSRLQSDNTQLKAKVEDLESHSRRNNLRVVGIPEKMEEADLVTFMADFFVEVLGTNFFASPPILDIAHRIGPPRTAGGETDARPRVFIVRFHYFCEKERVLRRQRDIHQLSVQRAKDLLFSPT